MAGFREPAQPELRSGESSYNGSVTEVSAIWQIMSSGLPPKNGQVLPKIGRNVLPDSKLWRVLGITVILSPQRKQAPRVTKRTKSCRKVAFQQPFLTKKRQRVRELAKQENVSINQFIAAAVAEKMSALMTAEYLENRAKQGDRDKFEHAMSKIPDTPPEACDRL